MLFLYAGSVLRSAEEEYQQRYLRKSSSFTLKRMTLCKVAGAHLRNHAIQSLLAEHVESCVIGCVAHPDCLSLNYIKSNHTCELNNVVSSDWIFAKVSRSDFIDDLDPGEYIHYTTQIEC